MTYFFCFNSWCSDDEDGDLAVPLFSQKRNNDEIMMEMNL